MYQPVLIGEYTSGLQTNRKPFMINQEAWAQLDNMWNFRGRMRKKFGYSLKGRLKITWPDLFIVSSGGGTENFNLITIAGAVSSATIDPGSVVITDGTTTWTDAGNGTFTGGTGTINYNTGAVSISSVAADDVFATFSYFPNLPVMGLRTREREDLNNEQTIAFDTNFSYRFVNGMWECLPNSFSISNITTGGAAPDPEVTTAINHGLTTNDVVTITGVTGDATMQAEVNNKSFVVTVTGATTFTLTGYTTTGTYTGGGNVATCEEWTGTDSQFFWTTNFQNPGTTRLFWAVNFDGVNTSDPIRYYNGTLWTDFAPNLNGAGSRTLDDAAIIEPYKERLLVFKTREIDTGTPTIYPQRIRWSEIGNVIDATNGWRDDIEGRGGFLDIPIEQAIVTVGFIRDRIIIYCERSTWELIYTGNELDPFKLRRINTELGAESRFSQIQFDNSLLGVGNTGVHSCNGDSVVRIDDPIPSFVFDIHNGNAGVERVYGIRDYYNEICFWTYPDSMSNPTYPNRMLIYNYRDNNWAIWKDCYTCFGYFQRADDRPWSSYTSTTWETAHFQWASGQSQSRFREIVAGNQNGYVLTFF
ncbi:MAG: ubiquitin-activating E1 FCCH domain-containing protein, partial [Candidatus Bathyarchaeota archaeon]